MNAIDEDGDENIFHIDEDICQSISMQDQAEGIEVVKKDEGDDNDVEDVDSDNEMKVNEV